MAPLRLLVIADPKMLPALTNGLRDGARFEVLPQPIGDLPAAQTASANADAIAIFYGTAERPLVSTVQQLAGAMRERGARVVAVLQKEQAPQRDDCFRAGASDVLFMPLPKDQFVSRLSDAVTLAWSGEGGQGAPQATVSTRTAAHNLEAAAVVAAGLLAPVGPELKAGESVRLAWTGAGASFSSWGLVVRSDAQGARYRIAGMAPAEESRFKEWLAGVKVPPVQPPPSWANVATVADSKVYAPTIAETPAIALQRPATPPVIAVSGAPPLTPSFGTAAAVLPPKPEVPAPPAPPSAAPAIAPTVVSLPAFLADEAPASTGNTNPGTRVPQGGPPPGFAARPPIRPQNPRNASRPGVPPMMVPTGAPGTAPASAPGVPASLGGPREVSNPGSAPTPASLPTAQSAKVASSPVIGAAKAPSVPGVPVPMLPVNGAPAPEAAALASPAPSADSGGLAALFDDVGAGSGSAAPGPAGAPEAPAGPAAPAWPTAFDAGIYKGWLAVMLRERNLPSEAGPELASAFLKVCGGLSSGERESLEKAGPESPFHEALVARAVLAFAGNAGNKLAGAQPPPVIDQTQLATLTGLADAAGKRLQAEADRAIGKGEVETLQLVTAASGPLSREQLAFKEVVDRLRGLGAAPRLGAGALDPDVQVPGQGAPKAKQATQQAEQQKRLELKEFEAFRNDPGQKSKKRSLFILAGVLGVALINALVFSAVGMREASNSLVEAAGTGVLQIQVSDTMALVKVTKAWFNNPRRPQAIKKLCEALEPGKTRKAVIELESGAIVGYIEIFNACKPVGLGAPPKPPDPNAPPK